MSSSIHRLSRPFSLYLLLVLLLAAANTSWAFGNNSSLFGGQGSQFLPVDEALPFSHTTDGNAVVLSWDITPEHYLYQDRISIKALDDRVGTGAMEFSSQGTETEDDYFGKTTVFFDPVTARVPVTLPDNIREARFEVTYQGCAKAGLCYPPQTREVLFYQSQDSGTGSQQTEQSNTAPQTDTNSATGLAGFLSEQSTLMIAGVFFLLGLGLTFTPCVLPMVPIISSLVSGQNTRTTGHALLLSGSYVLGMALTYAGAGVLTGLLGASFNLQAQLQSPWVLGVFALMFVVFALSMFDLFEIQLPRFISQPLNDASQRLTGGRVVSIFGIGALSALIVSPCVSAPLAGSLLYISTTQDAVIGGIALLSLGLGMGIPLILVAVGGRTLLPKTGHWMTTVKHFYGVMLIAVAIWLIERLVPGWLGLTLWGGLLAITGVQLGAFDAAKAGWERTRKGLGLILFAYGLALLAGAIGGANDPLAPLDPFIAKTGTIMPSGSAITSDTSHADFTRVENPAEIEAMLLQARQDGRPVVLDFYADWCISCKVMERNVFSDASVVRALSSFTLLQIDMTDNTPAQQAMLDSMGLFGPPAILFYDTTGTEMTQQRVLGEMDRDQFLNHINGLSPAT
ncbi:MULTISPECIES: protein-disulfide reductase DsbD [unclassified Marinobacter]|uniref:protein-disulfide reductase DsbD n=1 Tax=unclassified Marinobacter TaxID=83889 RepID=UPI0026E2AE8F|nr:MULTISPECIES: protein-disulfide reductase DsbD [unclassified Marinobacter]MDO6440594.1 protein-disulfide reductase DsbD [Marinobacter sp. 2_MG-2023]MDO6823422.1 protein-disulfide reductase DsbD [Marinobacter sp. 1_MG-2023]